MPRRCVIIAALVLGLVDPVDAGSHGPTGHASPALVCNGDGGFVVVWQARGQDGDDEGIVGQRFASSGAKLDPAFRVNTHTTDRQASPALCASDAGDFVVAWHSYGQDGDGYGVVAQRFDSTGTRTGTEFQTNSTTAFSQGSPALACAADGTFVVVWSSGAQDGEDYGIVGRRYDSSGQPLSGELQINTYTSTSQVAPAVASDGRGDFVVAWTSYENQDGDGYGVLARRFDSAGTALGGEFLVNSETLNSQLAPSVAINADDGLVVAWSSHQDGDDGYGIFAQRYDRGGLGIGGEYHVNTATAGDQGVSLGGGIVRSAGGAASDVIVVWQSSKRTGPAPDGDGVGVFAQRLTGSPLQPVGTELQVNTTTLGDQAYPAVCRTANGGFVVAWESRGGNASNDGIFAQRYGSDGTPEGAELQVNTPCPGDCDHDEVVSIDEVLIGVSMALGLAQMRECTALDRDRDDAATIDEVVAAVRAAVGGCPRPRFAIESTRSSSVAAPDAESRRSPALG